ncbi:hypothetical protein DCS_05661 [Drechmeria coniospora]|uniref:Uncharacterized protein n=1 Tax=Drechmeria coniospora TaxID=98403 RepID=A0A151GNE6_DRECN|nr:hypothetical protein DCS_05661 [Drechmeria coniospora]KYK58644.1 hypothetical protein DCS_05661 [Drechmeria coniospora]
MRRAVPPQVRFICESCASVGRASKQGLGNRLVRSGSQLPGRSLVWRPIAARWSSVVAASSPAEPETAAKETNAPATWPQMTDPQELANVAEDSGRKFLSVDGIPAHQLTGAALRSCLRAASALHPQLKRAESLSKASASRLVSLGAQRVGARLPIDGKLQESINRISCTAYKIITHPNVEMTAEFLEAYVQIQYQLGRPESLPSVLDLYATKPKPVVRDGQIHHVAPNPNAAVKAIETDVAEMALQTAIDARSLDSALGIVQAAYAVPAFKRQKILKNATAPALGLATLPFGIFGLSTAYASYWQNTMDVSTATGLCVAGISGYFFVVGSLGMIAKLSNKDQMKRVTWSPGTPLRYRWLREDERRALDKVACAWGFKEPWRHGEETGPEWEGLKEYMGYRQMLLDRVEFMEGMG